jgi:hypothetical protein
MSPNGLHCFGYRASEFAAFVPAFRDGTFRQARISWTGYKYRSTSP